MVPGRAFFANLLAEALGADFGSSRLGSSLVLARSRSFLARFLARFRLFRRKSAFGIVFGGQAPIFHFFGISEQIVQLCGQLTTLPPDSTKITSL